MKVRVTVYSVLLKQLLIEAKNAHIVMEQDRITAGDGPDPDWPGWYANFMVRQLAQQPDAEGA